jgi:urease accessory protein
MLLRSPHSKAFDGVTPAVLYRLAAWFSPSFPVGAFSYSSGIEWAVEARDIADAPTLQRWIKVTLAHGGGFSDAVFFAHAHRAVMGDDKKLLRGVAELAAAFIPSKERYLETTQQGHAFCETIRASWPCAALDLLAKVWDGPIVLPVAAGVATAGHDIPAKPALHAYLQAMVANLVSAGVRLIPLGQTDGQRLIAALEDEICATVERALAPTLDDVGTCAFRVDLSSMRHETQYTRLFRS